MRSHLYKTVAKTTVLLISHVISHHFAFDFKIPRFPARDRVLTACVSGDDRPRLLSEGQHRLSKRRPFPRSCSICNCPPVCHHTHGQPRGRRPIASLSDRHRSQTNPGGRVTRPMQVCLMALLFCHLMQRVKTLAAYLTTMVLLLVLLLLSPKVFVKLL